MNRAWLAGFIDGEGTIGLYKRNEKSRVSDKKYLAFRPLLQIANTNEEVISQIAKELNVKYQGGKNGQSKKAKTIFKVSICGNAKLCSILSDIGPFLCVKSEQAKLLLKYCRYKLNQPPSNKNYSRTGSFDTDMCDKLHVLNRRGVG